MQRTIGLALTLGILALAAGCKEDERKPTPDLGPGGDINTVVDQKTSVDAKQAQRRGILAFDAVFIIYAYKENYIIEISAPYNFTLPDAGGPDGGAPSCKATVKSGVVSFVQQIVAKLPYAAAVPDGGIQKVEKYVPASGAITGWTEDTTVGNPGIESGYTKAEIVGLINGHHDPYDVEGCNGFAMEYFKKDFSGGCSSKKLMFYIWDMKTTAAAKKMFDKNKSDGETKGGLTFEDITL